MARVLLATWFFALCVASVYADTISGEVVGIADGDTITVLTREKQQVKVRLSEIDTPESGQPYGSRAGQALAAMVFREQVRVIPETTDRYGRTVGRVMVGKTDVNAEMVRAGHAWVYREYVNREILLDLETEAREARRGIWKLPESDRVAPWTWRKLRREGKTVQQAASESADERSEKEIFECGAKRYCGDMASCKEARFFLTECGVTSLDRDNDGIPCEAICN